MNQVTLKDYSFKKPAYDFLQQAQAGSGRVYEYYDAPGRYKDDAQGKTLTRARLDFLQRDALTATGASDQAALQAGIVFTLTGHPFSDNAQWQVVEITHQGTQPQVLEEGGGAGQTTYHNHFTLIPADRLWQATPCPWPLMIIIWVNDMFYMNNKNTLGILVNVPPLSSKNIHDKGITEPLPPQAWKTSVKQSQRY